MVDTQPNQKSVSNRDVRIWRANKQNTLTIVVHNYLGHPPFPTSDFSNANTAHASPKSSSAPIQLPSWLLIASSQLCMDSLDYHLSIYNLLLLLRSDDLNYFGRSPPSDLLTSVSLRGLLSPQNAVWSGIGPSSYFELKVDAKFVLSILMDSSFLKD